MSHCPWLGTFSRLPAHRRPQTEVWQHAGLQAVAKGGGGGVELQQGVQALLLSCALQGRAQAHGDGRNHGAESLDEQHCHHLVGVLEDLRGADGGAVAMAFPHFLALMQDLGRPGEEGRVGIHSACLTWLLH